MPDLAPGINTICKSEVIFTTDGATTNSFSLSLSVLKNNDNTNVFSIEPTSYLSGDLAFLSFMMGEDGFSSACWQLASHVKPEMIWDMAGVEKQAQDNIQDGNKGTEMNGVRRTPLLEIPFANISCSGLHAGISISNRLVQVLDEFIDVQVENLSHKEYQLQGSARETTDWLMKYLESME